MLHTSLLPFPQVEVTKRHAFLTMVVGVVAQHLAFFRQGAALLGRMEGPYSDAMAIVDHLRKEGMAKQVIRGDGGGERAKHLCADRLGRAGANTADLKHSEARAC